MNHRPRRLVGFAAVSVLAILCSAGVTPAAYADATPAATEAAPVAQAQSMDHLHPRRASHRYVALGDSYSSGEGSEAYVAGTDTADNRCHRSRLAYPRLLADRQPKLRRLSFVACSGASTRDLYHRNDQFPSEPRQLAALRRRTKAVTITIGANDVGFAQVISACVAVGPLPDAHCASDLDQVVRARIAALAGHRRSVLDPDGHAITPIRHVLSDIHSRAPHARIYVAGYPRLFGHQEKYFTGGAVGARTCIVNPTVNARITFADAQWLNRRTRQLDRDFRTAARQARRAGISAHYVSASTFDGHGLCDAKHAWVQPLLLNGLLPRRESFHPTRRGQRLGSLRAFERAGL